MPGSKYKIVSMHKLLNIVKNYTNNKIISISCNYLPKYYYVCTIIMSVK